MALVRRLQTAACSFVESSWTKRLFFPTVISEVKMSSLGLFRVEMISNSGELSFFALSRMFHKKLLENNERGFIRELISGYAIAKLRKTGYSKNKFYIEAVELYKEINILMADGDNKTMRKNVTERMYSALNDEIIQREAMWGSVYWEMVEPLIKTKTLQARLITSGFSSSLFFFFFPSFLATPHIGIDMTDLNKAFIQLTLEFLTKQVSVIFKSSHNDSKGRVVAGDKRKEVLVRDIWVFEKSLFHTGACWRLYGRIELPTNDKIQPAL
ncbi:hypothetical protein Bca52824_019665 [Brassica carinata]|uniref:Large ribosomal subunit protein mL45 n=1 Tax=Brassica carinata TaxID=52824 RepID=A0A8X7VT10_BRACI|nr:hypothetical protein Bca52824_019665 [Brassica carinata]